MLNLKLKTIASLINKEDCVLDTCCDHAYLAIYLQKNNLCKEVYASDISKNAVEIAKKNVEKENLDIPVFLSDGLKNINVYVDTVVISGVGAYTALDIVLNAPHINKFIISSNNNTYLLRKSMLKYKYYIENEVVIKENNKYYPIMVFTKKFQKEDDCTLKYGKSNNSSYYTYLKNKEEDILKKLSNKEEIKTHQDNINYLEKLLKSTKEKNVDC